MNIIDISPNDDLIRRIPKTPSHLKDGRPTSACFKLKPGEDGISVDILRLTTVRNSIKNPKTHLAGILRASIPINYGCNCVHSPVESNEAHALIKDVNKAIARKLASECIMIELENGLISSNTSD